MPRRFEAHAKLSGFTQHERLYATDDRFSGGQASASLGSRSGGWSWWVNLNHLDSQRSRSASSPSRCRPTRRRGATTVQGAVAGTNPKEQPWLIFGATGQTHTLQDHAKLKLAYDLSPALRVSYTLGLWHNDAQRPTQSFLRDVDGHGWRPARHRSTSTPTDTATR
jgi:iron complex outermembrane receptor protein